MKRALAYVVVVMFVAMASAQVFAQANPLLGTWKLNVAKSKFTGTPMPKYAARQILMPCAAYLLFREVGSDGDRGGTAQKYQLNRKKEKQS